MNKDLVNTRNTREWIKCNDDAKSHIWRNKFIEEHSGTFVQDKKQWIWEEKEEIVPDTRLKQTRKEYIFINKDGVEFLTDNFTKFCRKHDLNRSALIKVMSGERKHHKGFTVIKLPPKED